MFLLQQFRPTFYLVLIMGMGGFALAAGAPGSFLLGLVVVLLHIWVVRSNRFVPLPRIVANIITVCALAYTMVAVARVHPPIIPIGQFLVLLQAVKLFELRANRDYGQAMLLSLLIMLAGTISTTSLLFGILFLVYLFVSLYAWLLFHIKVEHDRSMAAQTLPPEKLNEATLRQDQRYLPRSIRRLCAVILVIAMISAVGVFLFFPRSHNAGLFGQITPAGQQSFTGFSGDVSLSQITRIAKSDNIVARVKLWRNGRKVEGTEPLYLRGAVASEYIGSTRSWRTNRTNDGVNISHPESKAITRLNASTSHVSLYSGVTTPGTEYTMAMSLQPSSNQRSILFCLPDPVSIRVGRDIENIAWRAGDQLLECNDRIAGIFDYVVVHRQWEKQRVGRTRSVDTSDISDVVRQYARKPEVCGVDGNGRSLGELFDGGQKDLAPRIAGNIEKHLRSTFSYTTDLPDQVEIDASRDPIDQFLGEWKRGHCELFASAMVLMLQSYEIDSRMIMGYRCDEYDSAVGDYYLVRQSHAHAWVEVHVDGRWEQYDPTSGNIINSQGDKGWWRAVKHFFAYVEFKWVTQFLAYDADQRENLIGSIDQIAGRLMANSGISRNVSWRNLKRWISQTGQSISKWLGLHEDAIPPRVVVAVAAMILAAVIHFILRPILKRRRIRKRAVRIGLKSLPASEQLRLARQLGFYERLMNLLQDNDIVQPPQLTPAEFSRSLIFLPTHAYQTIDRLTQAFYSIRYGDRSLTVQEQQELEQAVDSLDAALNKSPAIR